MPEGLLVINDSNFIQIDSEFKNHRLVQTGTINIPGPLVSAPELVAGEVNTFINGVNPILAYRSASTWAMCSLLRTGIPTVFQLKALSDTAGAVDFYIFDDVAPTPLNYGLQVFNAAGVQVYDSGDKSLRVLEVFNQGSVLVGTDVQRTYAGKKVAIITSGNIRFIRALTGTLQENMGLGCKVIGDPTISHRFTTVRRFITGAAQNYISSRVTSRLVVDVTGF